MMLRSVRFASGVVKTVAKCPPPCTDTGCTFCLSPEIRASIPEIKCPPYSVANTAPPMDKMIVYLSGDKEADKWPKKMEGQQGSVMERLARLKRGTGVGVVHSTIKAKSEDHEFLVYPGGKRVAVGPGESLESFFDGVCAGVVDGPVETDPVVLICGHAKRDVRCGVVGPMVLNEFERVSDACVGLCSHVGGHVYAGNVLVCRPQRVDWYGMVGPEKVQGLVEIAIEDNGIIQELYRGSTCVL